MSARRCFSSALVTLALVAAACGGGDDATAPSGSGNPPPSQNQGTLVITNAAPSDAGLFIRFRACNTSGAWSGDLLGDPNNGAGAIMFGGEAGSWQMDAGCYDVRVTPSGIGLDYFYAYSVQVPAGQSVAVTIDAFPLAQ